MATAIRLVAGTVVLLVGQANATNALVPVVSVTWGPTVARSTYDALVVVCFVITVAVPDAGNPPGGMYDQVLVAVFIKRVNWLMARALIVPAIVTPAPAVGVQRPEPKFNRVTCVPIGKATLALAGIVMVVLVLSAIVMTLPASVRTKV